MTLSNSAAQDAGGVRVRTRGAVPEEDLAYLRAKVGAALDRPGLPAVTGEVRIARATASHTEAPWSAGGEIRVGGELVVVHDEEPSARELADRLHDLLRARVDRLTHRGEAARRAATPPPWRGGPTA
ncbi:hypothetical protein [Streptomyces flavalbus]|uniref:HPF/RaiA family ribosome-associated protein n=1 Tax=Streptomyces flavalbus TaxID=2665155 RepID=A0ABW2WJY1_9ACTN